MSLATSTRRKNDEEFKPAHASFDLMHRRTNLDGVGLLPGVSGGLATSCRLVSNQLEGVHS